MIMKKKFIIGMLLVLSLFMVACSNKKEEAQGEGKVLKVAVSEDTTTLEPNALSDDYEVLKLNLERELSSLMEAHLLLMM